MKKGDKKVIRGWVFYDWANSVYNLVIASAIFPIFYNNITTNRFLSDNNLETLPEGMEVTVEFFGATISSSVLMSFVLSASFLVVSILSPMLSGVADVSGSKKRFMQFFNYMGATACISLFWFQDVPIEVGILSIFIASIGFWNSLVFYNAYLPEIAEPKDHDRISARGFSMGYLGSMILLVICLGIVMFTGENGSNTSWSFVLVGIWWFSFSQITYKVLPNNVYGKKKEKGAVWKGFKELQKVFKEFAKTKRLKRYLAAFFFFNTGVQTVMIMAVYFADKEIEWPEDDGGAGLIVSILLIQVLGALGAFLMSKVSQRIGNIKTLSISVSIWVLICVAAYFVKTPTDFYMLAAAVGLVMGGVQAIARSTYSKFLPETTDHASYFSFYDVTEKVGMVVGTFSFGFLQLWLGSIRYSVVSVAAFFFIGLILLFLVPKEETLPIAKTAK
ncbi:MAG TPA: MFS transporter [Crocinitomicaceae bacterium]|nr:MFS transporter [Crocinitomicaceae bacterium]